MKQHADEFSLAAMCRMLGVHRSGYYARLKEPQAIAMLDVLLQTLELLIFSIGQAAGCHSWRYPVPSVVLLAALCSLLLWSFT